MIKIEESMKPSEITPLGYKNLGIFTKWGDKKLQEYVMKATVSNKCDLIILPIDDKDEIFHLFIKEYK